MLLRHEGKRQSVEEWALDYGIPVKLIRSRLKRGWSVERAITEPMHVRRGEKLPADAMVDTAPASPSPPVQPQPIVIRPPSISTVRPMAPRQRKAKRITFRGCSLTMPQWAARLRISRNALANRFAQGWPLERALGEVRNPEHHGPVPKLIAFDGESLTVKQWAERLGIDRDTLHARLRSPRWTLERALTTPRTQSPLTEAA